MLVMERFMDDVPILIQLVLVLQALYKRDKRLAIIFRLEGGFMNLIKSIENKTNHLPYLQEATLFLRAITNKNGFPSHCPSDFG